MQDDKVADKSRVMKVPFCFDGSNYIWYTFVSETDFLQRCGQTETSTNSTRLFRVLILQVRAGTLVIVSFKYSRYWQVLSFSA